MREMSVSPMQREATSLSRTYHSPIISINRVDRFHSVMGLTGAGKSSVGSHGWIFPLTRHLVIHVYSSSTLTWAKKRHKWVTVLNRVLRPSGSLSLKIFPKTSLGIPGALSSLTHQGLITSMERRIQQFWRKLRCGWHHREFSISLPLPSASCLT